jgi:thiamine-monophosphate kinase
MPLGEFELIARYFSACGAKRSDVKLGVGDDAALLECAPGEQLVAAIDTLVSGRHFPEGSPANSIGHRALAINLSDLAAMGARPAWALLAVTLPNSDETWIARFATGFSRLARIHDVALVGGDTTAGPLTVTVQVLGHVPPSKALLRSGGKPGDILYVSGTPGDAAAGLAIEQGQLQVGNVEHANYLRERFLFPTPRIELGQRLRDYASACIDVSDGLLGDAVKIARASCCGVEISYPEVPVSAPLIAAVGEERARELALTGGDDYELCFSVQPAAAEALQRDLPPNEWGYRRIGSLRVDPGAVVLRDGIVMEFSHSGFDHFRA